MRPGPHLTATAPMFPQKCRPPLGLSSEAGALRSWPHPFIIVDVGESVEISWTTGPMLGWGQGVAPTMLHARVRFAVMWCRIQVTRA